MNERFSYLQGEFLDGHPFSMSVHRDTGDPFKTGRHWELMAMIAIIDSNIFSVKSDGEILIIPLSSVRFVSGAGLSNE
jgi:hypothetical protein